jgi:hypothetical protein
MAKYSLEHIQRLLTEADAAATADEKGDKLEELVCYLFGVIPGVEFIAKNILDGNRAHELDVVFWNDQRISELHFLDAIIITECKHTQHPVGSIDVGWFVRKLQDRGAACGILISLNGITGERDGVSNAHSEVLSAMIRDRIKILVITREDILNLSTTEQLVSLLREKILGLTLDKIIIQ